MGKQTKNESFQKIFQDFWNPQEDVNEQNCPLEVDTSMTNEHLTFSNAWSGVLIHTKALLSLLYSQFFNQIF